QQRGRRSSACNDTTTAGVGFEPTSPCGANDFQDRPVRPLRHPAEPPHCRRRLLTDVLGRAVLPQHVGDVALEVLEDREHGAAGSQNANSSTLLNWCSRNIPRVSLPAAPASRRKFVENAL